LTRNTKDAAGTRRLPPAPCILPVLLAAALLQAWGCRDGKPGEKPGKTAPHEEAEAALKAPGDAAGQAAQETVRPWADLLAEPQSIEVGPALGGRFVDLRHPSGLWSLGDAKAAADLENQGGGGIPLGKKPLILRLHGKDAGAARVLLAVESDEELALTVKAGSRGAGTSHVGPGLATVPVKRSGAADAGGKTDIAVSTSGKPGPSPPRLLGLWLWDSDGDPPLPPARPSGCGKEGKGLRLEPGAMLMAATALPEVPVIRAEASGPGRADLALEVEQDQAETANVDFKSTAEERAGIRVLDHALTKGPWAPAEIRVVLEPHAAGAACIEKLEIVTPAKQVALRPKPFEGVVLVMTDTMRGDLFSWKEVYRTPGMTVSMPGLQALAAKSYRFVWATSHASYTKPSVATMLTGLYPSEHGALGRKHAVRSSVALITEKLEDAGVHTAGILSNYFFNPRFGMRKGWTDAQWADPFKASIDDALVLDELESYLEASTLPSPFFLYIHLSGAHAPYAPPQEARENIASRLLSPSVDPVGTTKVVKAYQSGRIGKIKKELLEDLVGLYRADAWYHDSIMTRLIGLLEKKASWSARSCYTRPITARNSSSTGASSTIGASGRSRSTFPS
jgi:hypothetical protein